MLSSAFVHFRLLSYACLRARIRFNCTKGWSDTLFFAQNVMNEGVFFIFLVVIVVGNFTIINIMIASILVQLSSVAELEEKLQIERDLAQGRRDQVK